MTNDTLKPCPFCGSEQVGSTWARMTDECQFYGVCCFDCKASLDKATAAEATLAWNTRTPPTSTDERKDVLEEAEVERIARTFASWAHQTTGKWKADGSPPPTWEQIGRIYQGYYCDIVRRVVAALTTKGD